MRQLGGEFWVTDHELAMMTQLLMHQLDFGVMIFGDHGHESAIMTQVFDESAYTWWYDVRDRDSQLCGLGNWYVSYKGCHAKAQQHS